MALETGTKAPDFTLKTKTSEGLEDVTLSNNFGKKKTVLLFFPLANTSVCTQEMCDVSQGLKVYEDMNAEVYGISVDSPFTQALWAEKEGIKLTLLSDFNREAASAYDVLYDELLGLKGVAKRSAFVVDQDGVIQHSHSSDNPKELPDFEAIKQVLSS